MDIDTYIHRHINIHCGQKEFVFKKFFWLKLFILKNTLHALNQLIHRGNKRSHVLK